MPPVVPGRRLAERLPDDRETFSFKVFVDAETDNELRRLALKANTSRSAYVRAILRRHVERTSKSA